MGSGIPIGGVGVKEEIAEKMEPTEHASTFGGNPLACVASLATIEIIEKEKLVENSRRMGEYLKRKLNEIGLETRGLGLMIGVDVDNAFEIVKRALEKGLVINATSERTLRLVPPLIIRKEEIDYAIEILNDIIK